MEQARSGVARPLCSIARAALALGAARRFESIAGAALAFGAALACSTRSAPHPLPPALPATARPAASPGGGDRFRFVDVAAEKRLTRITWAGRPGKDHLLDSAGTGAAFLDYDRDGILDVYVVNGWKLDGPNVIERGRNALYRGLQDGAFEDVTDAAGVGGEGRWGSGVAAADYDLDGWTDLFVTSFGASALYRNRGDGTFEDLAPGLGLESPGWNTGAAFLDADGDGDLDLYVASYIDCALDEVLEAKPTMDWKGVEKVAMGPFGLAGAPDHFFRSEGARRFVDATEEAGMKDRALGYGFAVRAADLDGDGDQDVYVANDSDANYFYRNDGHGHFDEVGAWTGCALDSHGSAQASMGVSVGDATGDGIPDIMVTNFSEDFSTFYAGLGGGFFEDVSAESGVGPPTFTPLSWGTAMADLDNDGDLDVVVVNGHIYPQVDRHPGILGTYAQRSLLLENAGNGRFVDATDRAGPGFQIARSGRGLAVGDYENDGDLDLLITSLDSPPALLRNESRSGAWLTVVCEAPAGSTVLGTTVKVTAGGKSMTRDIASGDSYLSTHDPRLHFGLGEAASADSVEVTWPDGTRSLRTSVPARQFLTVRKGD